MTWIRLEFLTAVTMKMAVLWVVVPCRLVWVSEVRTASIMRAIKYHSILGVVPCRMTRIGRNIWLRSIAVVDGYQLNTVRVVK
jgi:hypothetical protein